MSLPRILFVEDEAPFRTFAGGFLEENGFQVTPAGDARTALDAFDGSTPDLVLLDLNLPDLHGLEVLRRLRARRPDLRVLVLTAYGDAANAVNALKAGATDYLTKPVELEVLLQAARDALGAAEPLGAPAAAEAASRLEAVREDAPAVADELLGDHPRWARVLERLERIVESDFLTLLFLGESGTGKTALARRFHDLTRRPGAFAAVHCPSVPEALLEGELFGVERGPRGDGKAGAIERAAGGTLFLDEIGELPPALQAKLLHFLEQRTFRRVGGQEALRTDVRVVCATNRDLKAAVEAGDFRRDLYYRLEVVSIQLPPLRDRGDDALRLAEHFAERFCQQRGQQAPRLSEAAKVALRNHPLPGNVRELRHLIERSSAFLSEPGVIDARDLDLGPATLDTGGEGTGLLPPVSIEEVLGAIEALYVEEALDQGASQKEAGALLGLDRFALARRKKRINRDGGRASAALTINQAPGWVRELIGTHPRPLPTSGLDLPALIGELEERVIERALTSMDGNRARAATLLGMSRTSLSRRLDSPKEE